MEEFFNKYLNTVEQAETIHYTGKVTAVKGLLIESSGPRSVIGEVCSIKLQGNGKTVLAEVVGLEGSTVRLTAFGETKGIEVGCEVVASGHTMEVPVGPELLGRVIDATGHACDGKAEITPLAYYPAMAAPPNPMTKKPVDRRVATGVRAIDGLLAVGKGQRMGIFAGSGVGKSTLMSMIARNTNADVNVIGLIGERGREVMDFIRRDLGQEGLKRSVVVVATSDQPSIARLRAAYVCTAIAEYFRDQGRDVLLMMDSLTRFSMAQREIGLASGEPPVTRGYPPSVYAQMPKLLERAGCDDKGSITGLYTVLVDGDDFNEPITDTARSILDGHIMLDRRLAHKNHYPAIDVLQSISRCMSQIATKEHKAVANRLKTVLATYTEAEDLINIGAYKAGANPNIDYSIEKIDQVNDFLCQDVDSRYSIDEEIQLLEDIFAEEKEPDTP